MKTIRWDVLKKERFSAREIREIEAGARKEALELTLKEIRQLAGKTQQEVSELTDVAQSELSRLERRDDFLLSTLKRYVEALGGEIEVFAVFGKRRIRLRES